MTFLSKFLLPEEHQNVFPNKSLVLIYFFIQKGSFKLVSYNRSSLTAVFSKIDVSKILENSWKNESYSIV